MRKFVLSPLVIFSHLLFAGGFSGGGPPPVMSNEDVLMVIQPDLGLERVPVSIDDFRRTRARLSVQNEATVNVAGEKLLVKEKLGGILDLSESKQLIPVKALP